VPILSTSILWLENGRSMKQTSNVPSSCSIVWLQAKGKHVNMTVHDDRSLLALQGPAAGEALQVRSLKSKANGL